MKIIIGIGNSSIDNNNHIGYFYGISAITLKSPKV